MFEEKMKLLIKTATSLMAVITCSTAPGAAPVLAENPTAGQKWKQAADKWRAKSADRQYSVRQRQKQSTGRWAESRAKWQESASKRKQEREERLKKARDTWQKKKEDRQAKWQDAREKWKDAAYDRETRQQENRQKWEDAEQKWQDAQVQWQQKWQETEQKWNDAQNKWQTRVDAINSLPHFPNGTFQVFIQDRVRFRVGGWSQTVRFKDIRKGMKLGKLRLTEKNARDLKQIIPRTLTFAGDGNHAGNLQQVSMSLNGKRPVKGLYNKKERKLLIGAAKGAGAVGNVGLLAGCVLSGRVNEPMNGISHGELNTGVLAAGPAGGVLADVTYFFNAFRR